MENKSIPEYYKYLNWYDLATPIGIYGFIQEMINDEIDLEDFPDIKIYYDILFENAFRNEPNMVTVDYVIHKIKSALVRYGFAHTTSLVNHKLYYYWYERK